ncbi:hypothetical protein TRAPUB_14327 [Trametes pubescens]|uniref:SMODS and SLOG-associating 2TM effector domain-containing protein n=1 Tax=Trametes pubescens TaxID=154538 RepID=A0A1M2VNZ6_TRAPU|nr:hypothetical protein TRAPUB_14327 [Trametes pubescens]
MDPQSNQQDHNTPPLPPLPPSPAGSSTEPHPSHEGHAPAPPPPAPAPGPPAAQPKAFTKPVPLPMPIAIPTPAHIGGVLHQSPASAPQTPSILRMSSPVLYSPALDNNAVAGPSSAGKQKQMSTPHASSEEDNAATSGTYNPPTRQSTMNTQGDSGDNGASSTKDYDIPTPKANTRNPTRTASTGRPGFDRNARSIVLTEPVAAYSGGNGLAQDMNPSGHASRPSVIDYVVPTMPVAGAGFNGHRRRQSMAMSAGTATIGGERTVEERMQPTLEAAIEERDKAALKAKAHAWALNCAIGAQVVLGALTTGVAAATTGRQTSIATSILGGMSTLAASYLAKARGSGEPEVSAIRARDLDGFIRDCRAFMLDNGFVVGTEYDARIERYRRRFEEIMGNGSGGVGDQVQAQREKGKSPV